MNEEEKKAIDYCKYTVSLADRLDEVIINLRKEPVIKILNLIEKQQKEIEELKDKNKSIVYNYEMVVDKLENSTLNDKIKAKIEEYEEILDSPIIKEDYKLEVQHIIRVLKELKGDN